MMTLALPATARKKKADKKKETTAAKAETTTQGLFTVAKNDSDWFLEIPDSLIGRKILATVRYTATPGGVGKYGGEQANQQTVYWEKAPNGKLLLRAEMLLNAADSTQAINRAVTISNSNPIIGAFKVESRTGDRSKIKVTQFFNEDNPALGLSSGTKKSFNLTSILGEQSYIESIKTFPLNTEVRTVKTWNTSSTPATRAGHRTGKVTIGLNISFVLLPKVPMQRRLFDPRVGYFTDQFDYYSDVQQHVTPKRFITRWRLEPKDSADAERMRRGELVEPKKPIVYYIDPATPKQWRKYLIAGVNDWQKAFEQAGFKNAIMAKEWPENDSTMSMEDARYSVIRYLASPIRNAYGPQVHDPRSGEIIESHIGWYHNIMALLHDWYMIQAGTLDEAAQKMQFDEELMGELIRFVSSHEVGHTLGLRHNFGASSTVPVDSLRNKAWVEEHGHTPSIMDYARFNYVAQPEDNISRKGIFPRIGDYDRWAIQWGYTPMFDATDDESDHRELEKLIGDRLRKNRRLWFGDGETNTTNDSRCQTEDLGDDAVKASEYGLLNLKREIKVLPEWTREENDIFNRNLTDAYIQIVGQFNRYTYHVARNIGGVYKDFKTVDEPGDVYTNVTREKQKEAFSYLERNVLTEPEWLIAEPYIKRLAPDPEELNLGIASNIIHYLASTGKLNELNAEYPAADYLADLSNSVFKETASGSKTTRYRRELQRCLVASLTGAFKAYSVMSPVRADVLQTLKNLQKRLSAASAPDSETRAHYAALSDAIQRALAID